LLDCKETNIDEQVEFLVHNQLVKTLNLLINYAAYLDQEWLANNQSVLSSLGEKVCKSAKEKEDYSNFITTCLSLTKELQDENSVSLVTGLIALPGYELLKNKENRSKIENFITHTDVEFTGLLDENKKVFGYIQELNEYLDIEAQNIQTCEAICDQTTGIIMDFIETSRDPHGDAAFSKEEQKLVDVICDIQLDSADEENRKLEALLMTFNVEKDSHIEPLRLNR
jgi:hypothetical protein